MEKIVNDLVAVKKRYDEANIRVIAVSDRVVFSSLQDILTLIAEIRRLRADYQGDIV